MGEQQRLQAQINSRVSAKIPTEAWASIVPIVIAAPPSVHLLGTGSLFGIAGDCFVVTAAHVIRTAHDHEKTIGISDAATSFIATSGDWISSAPVQHGDDDPFDVAVYKLPEPAVERLRGKRFVRRADVDLGEQSATAVFTLFCFPGLLATASQADDERLQLTPLEYTTHASSDNRELLNGFNPRYHLLLDGTPRQVTWPDGSDVRLEDKAGRAATLPRDLKGISGCSVWTIGDLKVPVGDWGPARVVGVETGVYQPSEVIRATRWVAVTTLLYEAFPQLRPALELWA